ncbi:hypothetical protein [Phenylobacterium sp.]|uniref:hypothetical protein n=1 Tax=Phenylobacterium sp. TaxID=1871053 RepID=UPI0037CA626F
MRVSTRYGLAGIGALGLLTTVHWIRDLAWSLPGIADYLIGVLPNFAAAIAIIFVLLSIWSDQNRDADSASLNRALRIAASISSAGLLCWELFQTLSNRLVFDPHDIGATLVGVGTACILFHLLTPRSHPDHNRE